MSTTAIILASRTTAANMSPLPEAQHATNPLAYAAFRPKTWTLPTIPNKRPTYKRRQSSDSPGWYNTEGGLTLDDFKNRLDTKLYRIEQWQNRCAQNSVMALMRPMPVVLFLCNPITVLIWLAVAVWRYSG